AAARKVGATKPSRICSIAPPTIVAVHHGSNLSVYAFAFPWRASRVVPRYSRRQVPGDPPAASPEPCQSPYLVWKSVGRVLREHPPLESHHVAGCGFDSQNSATRGRIRDNRRSRQTFWRGAVRSFAVPSSDFP